MNVKERIKMVKCMEFICRQINDENVFMRWLEVGVADGDIPYGELCETEFDEDLECYVEFDDTFATLLRDFLNIMSAARRSGGLYCDGVVDRGFKSQLYDRRSDDIL